MKDGFLERGNITPHAAVWNHFDRRAAQTAEPQTAGLSANLVHEQLHKTCCINTEAALHSQPIYEMFLSGNFSGTCKIKKKKRLGARQVWWNKLRHQLSPFRRVQPEEESSGQIRVEFFHDAVNQQRELKRSAHVAMRSPPLALISSHQFQMRKSSVTFHLLTHALLWNVGSAST